MKIRPAGPEDIEELSKIERACFLRDRFSKAVLRSLLADKDCQTFMAEVNGEVVGAIIFFISDLTNRARLISIAVMPESRNKGVGKGLLKRAEEVSRKKRMETMSLEVGFSNVAAINLYLQNNFRIMGLIPDYYGPSKHAFYMEKRLRE